MYLTFIFDLSKYPIMDNIMNSALVTPTYGVGVTKPIHCIC